MYTDKIVKLFKEYGYDKELDLTIEYYRKHQDKYIHKLKPVNEKPKSLIGQNGIYYLQNSLFRSLSLTEAWTCAINSENVISGALITRAHYEVTGSLSYFLKYLIRYHALEINEEEFDMKLKRISLGNKLGSDGIPVNNPYNVLNFIQNVDELYRKETGNKEKIFQETYDILSEFSHPNLLGLAAGNMINKVGIVRYDKMLSLKKEDIEIFCYMHISLGLFFVFYDKARWMLEEKEELPIYLDY